MKPGRSAIAAAALVLLTVTSGVAQQSAASLSIRFEKNTRQFHVGEVISLELSFRASIADTYVMGMRNYDRSGRLNVERYYVTPPGRDPLQSYYSGGLFAGGGLSSLPEYLSSDAKVMRQSLNEWVAIDVPGHYRVYVTSARVTRAGESKPEPVEMRSNTLEFDVVPATLLWQEQTLSSALSLLNRGDTTDEEKQSAIASLRYLDSPASIRELVRQVVNPGERGNWQFVAGLMGSRFQRQVLGELEAQLSNSDAAITTEYLSLLARTEFGLSHDPLPSYPQGDQERQKAWVALRESRMKQFAELQDRFFLRTAQLVRGKNGLARAQTVKTLLLRPVQGPSDVKAGMDLPEAEIGSAFLTFSPEEQWNLLQSSWPRLKVAAMAGALKELLDQVQISHQMVRDVALQRLHELDPNEANARILAEIRKPHLDAGMFLVSGKTLGLLPSGTMPELDELLAARWEIKDSRTQRLDAQLIDRYATNAIFPRVRSVYERALGQWECAIEDALVSYFVRVDADYGVAKMRGANGNCLLSESLKSVVRMKRWSDVEPTIIERLNGPNLSVARSAAETLAKYGGAEAEQALWERLRRFHEEWAGHEREFRQVANMRRELADAVSFQFGLVESLGKAQAWLLEDEQITELERLTLGPERENVARWHWRSPVNVSVNVLSEGRIHATINEYSVEDLESLQAKLMQYPIGTRFWMTTFGPAEQLEAAILTIDRIVREKGFVLDRAPRN